MSLELPDHLVPDGPLDFEGALKLADQLQTTHPELAAALNASMLWAPLDGPQRAAYYSEADELFYGGAAGGGKTDLSCGLALEEHIRSVMYRREGTQFSAITDRLEELLGSKDTLDNSTGNRVWRLGERQIEYGSMPNPGDERKRQGRPYDLMIFDELPQFLQQQYTYLQTWNRPGPGVPPTQRCRVLSTGNPPTDPEGLWVMQYWGPWLDPDHVLFGKVKPGELVYYVPSPNGPVITDDPGIQEVKNADGTHRWVMPRSRTFIPAKVEDNAFLMASGYADALEGLPETLRRQMREGDFLAGQEDNAFQTIPSAWVKMAQLRWKMRQHEPRGPMSAMGVDPVRGGGDSMVLTPRFGTFIGEQHEKPGREIPDGPAGAAFVVQHLRNGAPCNVDVIGVGSSVVDDLRPLVSEVNALNGSAASHMRDKTGTLKMNNLRAAMYWHMRELLDPASTDPLALPPSNKLLMDLCAPRYSVSKEGVLVESKQELLRPSRLGRSPDWGDSAVYSVWDFYPLGALSQEVMSARDDPYTDGPYVREATRRKHEAAQGWGGFNGTIHYPDDP